MAAGADDILELGAILQRDEQTYAVTPRIPCGLITDFDILRKIAEVAEKYGARAIKVTSSQRIAIIGIRQQDLEAVWGELGMKPGMASGMCIRSVKACPGTQYCRLGMQDSLALGMRLEGRWVHAPMPNKLKIAVSGCPLDCAESHVRDIGLVGNKKGYTVELGGSAGASPRLADVVAEGLSEEQTEALVAKVIGGYQALGKKKRIGSLIDRLGLEAFKEQLGI
jgi:NAD(P)H-nitrite reductase large subunit